MTKGLVEGRTLTHKLQACSYVVQKNLITCNLKCFHDSTMLIRKDAQWDRCLKKYIQLKDAFQQSSRAGELAIIAEKNLSFGVKMIKVFYMIMI